MQQQRYRTNKILDWGDFIEGTSDGIRNIWKYDCSVAHSDDMYVVIMLSVPGTDCTIYIYLETIDFNAISSIQIYVTCIA